MIIIIINFGSSSLIECVILILFCYLISFSVIFSTH